mgnify:CR=1 FL=1
MPRRAADGRAPRWAGLYETAAGQAGYFSLEQARAAGCSAQLLQYHLTTGRLERSIHGMFRLVHFPPSDREDLVPVWVWSRREGVFGIQTALLIHELSDVLPAKHFYVDDVPRADWRWFGGVPVTTPARTLRDCVQHHVSPEFVEQAVAQAVRRGLVSRTQVRAMRRDAG